MASNSSADRRRRYLSSAVVSLVGVAMLGVPLYDVYDDVTSLGWSLGATLVENSVLVVLASGLVAGGVWLARRDWEPRHVETVSTWTLAGTAGTALAFAWVGALQLWSMHALKPVVLALDGVLFGAVATFGVGIYSARTDRHTEELERERERFAGLFTNTSDAVAALGVGADGVSVAMVNDEFRGQFGDDPERVFDDALAALDGVTDRRDLATRLRDGETLETDLHVHGDTDDEQGAFLVRFVPYEDRDTAAHCYLVATDVTERRRLARERERNHRLTELHRTASTLQETTDDASACETALDAVERLLDPARSRVVLDGDGESRVFERTADDATARPETTVRSWLGDGGFLEVATAAEHPDEYHRTVVDLLGTHLDRTLDRLERERRVEAEREQLEFVNRTLRHNLLNDIQVVSARLQLLERDDVDFEDHRDVVAEHVDSMAEFVQTMRAYVQALVDDGERTLEPRSVRSVVADEVSKTRRDYPSASVTLGDVPDVEVAADDLLGPLFENLLTNAVEHNDTDEPTVVVDGERETVGEDGEEVVRIRVADDGPGIETARRERIFERGELGEESSGSGFGLYLVAEAVESYGGEVTVEDSDLGGVAFEVTLPVAT
ncbi:sensor histidine kinase [Halospeciosus flavus]|uniref:histidine kinase n=1 Tax=Halospeciosus flavus TaxID=3032283 RepID=A0ABD5Z154_9EURY|nr:PAS domain-containing sensor histidine kinase [Halospeciosus flavus]